MKHLIIDPTIAFQFWHEQLLPKALYTDRYVALKALIRTWCQFEIGGWTKDHLEYLKSFQLPAPRDKYASVRSGEVFLSAEESARIVEAFDRLNGTEGALAAISDRDLELLTQPH